MYLKISETLVVSNQEFICLPHWCGPTSVKLSCDPVNVAVMGHRPGWTYRKPETLALAQTWV